MEKKEKDCEKEVCVQWAREQKDCVLYSRVPIPADHWALSDKRNSPDYIATLQFTINEQKITGVYYANPTDGRRYRTVFKILGALNRPLTFEENIARGHADTFLRVALDPLGIVQSSTAGSNTMELDARGQLKVGEREPYMAGHLHIYIANNPEKELIPGLKLNGPEVKVPLLLLPSKSAELGNQNKVPLTPEQTNILCVHLAALIKIQMTKPETKLLGNLNIHTRLD